MIAKGTGGKVTGRDAVRIAGVYAAGICAGWLFARLGLPLPWMIGPLLSTALLSFGGFLQKPLPVATRPFGQAVVASTVGLSFTAEALRLVVSMMPVLVAMCAITAGLAFAMSVVQARMAGARLSRMLLATFPVAPVEAAILAEHFRIPAAPVVMAQTLRIAAVVVAVPLLLYAIDGRPETAGALPGHGDWNLPGLALLVPFAAIGGLLFRVAGWVNPFFLGPLAMISALTACGVPLSHYPPLVLGAAQVVLGGWLGSTFQPALFRGARRELAVSLFGTPVLLVLTCLGAVALSALTPLSWETVILGMAPGGVTEMALTAQYLHQNLSLVTAAHLVRIFLLMPLARPLMRLADRLG